MAETRKVIDGQVYRVDEKGNKLGWLGSAENKSLITGTTGGTDFTTEVKAGEKPATVSARPRPTLSQHNNDIEKFRSDLRKWESEQDTLEAQKRALKKMGTGQ
jgi:hypothetical protein